MTALDTVRPVDPFEADRTHFPTALQQFQFYDKYSRWDWDKGRRETWEEAVDRVVEHLRWLSGDLLEDSLYQEIRLAILHMEVMPSMRLLAMAGEAARRNGLAIYNCAALGIDSLGSFGEMLAISMAGCGVGWSVERQYTGLLPFVLPQTGEILPTFVVEDTTEGWVAAYDHGVETWISGRDVYFDLSGLRPRGSILRVKGGRSSGPDALRTALENARGVILSRQGQFLRAVDCADIACHTGEGAISGGQRRTAMLGLFDDDDDEMRAFKSGNFWESNPQRKNVNISSAWGDMTFEQVYFAMSEMHENGTGEPGIFNRAVAQRLAPDRRDSSLIELTNPCGEINLRNRGLCNLSSVIARNTDTIDSLRRKVRLATIIGTIQSMSTHFPGMREEWVKNAEEERLLGVDINGQQDCPLVQSSHTMAALKTLVLDTNAKYASILGIPRSAATTCVKPNGNSSLLVDCSSGLHARWAPFSLRAVRVDKGGPVHRVLETSGVPLEQDHMSPTQIVAYFPVRAPEGTKTRKDRGAIEQLEYWLKVKKHWTEHNPSCSIGYSPEELPEVIEWVYANQDWINGLSFYPNDDAVYPQAPWTEISESEYWKALDTFPTIDWSLLQTYEEEDRTTSAQEVSCAAGACDINMR